MKKHELGKTEDDYFMKKKLSKVKPSGSEVKTFAVHK